MAASASEIAYETQPTPGETQKRLIERVCSLYRKNDLTALLPLATLESLALPGESYKLALTRGLLDVFKGKASPSELTHILAGRDAAYCDVDGSGPYWIPSGRVYYSPKPEDTPHRELSFALRHFFLPHRYRDPLATSQP